MSLPSSATKAPSGSVESGCAMRARQRAATAASVVSKPNAAAPKAATAERSASVKLRRRSPEMARAVR